MGFHSFQAQVAILKIALKHLTRVFPQQGVGNQKYQIFQTNPGVAAYLLNGVDFSTADFVAGINLEQRSGQSIPIFGLICPGYLLPVVRFPRCCLQQPAEAAFQKAGADSAYQGISDGVTIYLVFSFDLADSSICSRKKSSDSSLPFRGFPVPDAALLCDMRLRKSRSIHRRSILVGTFQ